MLVVGWTFMGTSVSSYGNTMGFGVSARVEEETTRSCDIPHYFLIKIKQLLQKHFVMPVVSESERSQASSNYLKIRRPLIRLISIGSGVTSISKGGCYGS